MSTTPPTVFCHISKITVMQASLLWSEDVKRRYFFCGSFFNFVFVLSVMQPCGQLLCKD